MMICGRGEQGGMTIHNTCIFLLMVHHHSVSEAARNLDLARPSFSVAIQEIEREYQVQLGYAEGVQMPRKQLFQENFLLWEKGSGTQDVVGRGDGTPLGGDEHNSASPCGGEQALRDGSAPPCG